jgi:hypothetical protein
MFSLFNPLLSLRLPARIVLCALAMFGCVTIVIKMRFDNSFWQSTTSQFAEEINLLSDSLPPGAFGTISVDAESADELILVPQMASRADIVSSLPSHSASVIDRICRISKNERLSPAAVWLKHGHVVYVGHLQFRVGVDLTPRSWDLRKSNVICIEKEAKSMNGFLSVRFVNCK